MRGYKTVIGLDIGHHTAKVVRADRERGKVVFSQAESLRLPGEGAERNEVIGRWIGKLGLAGYPCVIGLSGRTVMFQTLTLSADDPRTLQQVASVEIVKFNELASETTAYGFTGVPAEGGERKLLLAMARPAVLDDVLALPRSLGMQVVDVVPSAVALFGAVAAAMPEGPSPFVCADIGSLVTEIAIGSRDGVWFARSFQSGSHMAPAETAQRPLSIPLRPASPAMDAGAAGGEGGTRHAARVAAEAWVAELDACLSLFRSAFPHEKEQPRRIVICGGGGADLSALKPLLSEHLGLEAIAPKDLEGAARLADAHRYMIAAGLAGTGFAADRGTLSLLPASIREDLALKRQKRYWILSGMAAALILGVSLLGGYRDFKRMERQLSTQRESLRRCQEIAQQIEEAKARRAVIEEMAMPVRALLQGGALMREVIGLVGASKDADDWVTMISDGESYFSPLGAPPAIRIEDGPSRRGSVASRAVSSSASTNSAFGRIIVEIYPRRQNPTRVRNLISLLRSSEVVKSADAMADDQIVKDREREEKWRGVGSQRYVIDVRTVMR